jgi:hypothetical protein
VKEAVNSAVDVMHTMTSSMCTFLSKVLIFASYYISVHISFFCTLFLS